MSNLTFLFAAVMSLGLPASPAAGALPNREVVVRYAAESGQRAWRDVQKPPPNLSSREMYTYALALSEANMFPERLKTLLEVGASMQERDPNAKGYGNFRWYYKDAAVTDYNAVEFCMQGGAPLWIGHRDSMPADARKVLADTLQFAVQGCLRHKVRENYTNIALMNAQNLILLGEALDKKEVAEEGRSRLDKICLYTSQYGIHEYCSPTYYGCDLDCLVIIEAFTKSDRARGQARALLELFWTDIALNWFGPAERLAGAHSRSYDYLRGRGNLDNHLWYNGWLGGAARGGTSAIFPALGRWQVPNRLRELNATRFPRLVRQAWGPGKDESRTHYLLADVTLSASGAHYHNMDFPLTADLGDPNIPRCYFTPDGRDDPYGTKKILEGGSGHNKALHLRPFFAGAQRRTDALGLAVYRDKDALPKEATSLQSHFVMPTGVEEVWLGERRVEIVKGKPLEAPCKPGEALVLVKGTAAVGVRVPWARDVKGAPSAVRLVYDANVPNAMRLTVTHHASEPIDKTGKDAGAAFWVRVGGGLKDQAAKKAFRQQFAADKVEVEVTADRVRVSVAGLDGPVTLAASAPFAECATVDPPSSRAVLELDGEDLGRRILRDVEPMRLKPTTGAAGGQPAKNGKR